MKERTEQDKQWLKDKQGATRINRLLLGGYGGCYKDGKFHRQLVPLKTILGAINREVKEVGSYPELGIVVKDRTP